MYFSFNKHKYIFEPKVFSTFVSLVALLILLSLSYWQIIRLEWKENLIEQRIKMFESDSVFLKNVEYPEKNEFLRVKIEGKFINELEMFMPALSKNGNNGYHILLPFELVNGEYIIFDRGWIPLKLKNRELRKKHEIYDSQKIEAVIRLPGKKGNFNQIMILKIIFGFL